MAWLTDGYLPREIGYPLVGVPLTWLGAADPCTPGNTLLFQVIVLLSALFGERLRGLTFARERGGHQLGCDPTACSRPREPSTWLPCSVQGPIRI
jgi:hypothetical protein